MDFLSAIYWLSLTIYGEARNQEHLDQLVVGRVIMNRTEQSSSTVKEVVLKRSQFSCFNGGVVMPTDTRAFIASIGVAVDTYFSNDFIGGADHYHTTKVKPNWRNKMSYVGQYGDHLVYKKLVKLTPDKKKVYSGWVLVRKSIWREV